MEQKQSAHGQEGFDINAMSVIHVELMQDKVHITLVCTVINKPKCNKI